jgi:hypothetical protein
MQDDDAGDDVCPNCGAQHEKMWMRVTDPGSPLCGWDLLCEPMDEELYEILAARRVDVLLGDRPLQFSPPDGLGMWIHVSKLEEAPIQGDGPIEIGTDREGLYGSHVETREYRHTGEGEMTHLLTVEVFTGAVQAALETEHDAKPVTKTWFGEPNAALLERLENLSSEGDVEGLLECLAGGDDDGAKN